MSRGKKITLFVGILGALATVIAALVSIPNVPEEADRNETRGNFTAGRDWRNDGSIHYNTSE